DGWQVKPETPFIWHVGNSDKGIKPKPLPWNKDLQSMPRCYAFLPRAAGQPVRLAVGHYHGGSIFEVTEGGVRSIWVGMGHEGEVMSLAVSTEGNWLVSASDDQTICAWSLPEWPRGSELGARFDSELGARFDVDKDGHVVVKKVDLFGPAWEAGLVEED